MLGEKPLEGKAKEFARAMSVPTWIGLDPTDPEDVALREDMDGLATGTEIFDDGTDPIQPDSNGDGFSMEGKS